MNGVASGVPQLVVAIDESPESSRPATIAAALATRIGTKIELLALSECAAQTVRLTERVTALGRELGSVASTWSVVPTTAGAAEFVRHARTRPGAVLVMTYDGPSRLSSVLDAPPAAQVLGAGGTVLAIGAHVIGHPTDEPVVVCIDGSTTSLQAVPTAAAWAAALRVPLTIMIVHRPPLRLDPASPSSDDLDIEATLSAAADLTTAWPDLVVERRVAGYPWNVADALQISLERHPAQLFVVATHVRDGIDRLVHPTVAGQIVRELDAPVLLVPITSSDRNAIR